MLFKNIITIIKKEIINVYKQDTLSCGLYVYLSITLRGCFGDELYLNESGQFYPLGMKYTKFIKFEGKVHKIKHKRWRICFNVKLDRLKIAYKRGKLPSINYSWNCFHRENIYNPIKMMLSQTEILAKVLCFICSKKI